MTSQSVRAATHALMRELGLTTVFGNPGSTELRFFKDVPDDFRYVLALQESAAVAMADGYAQATRRPAFVNLHSAVGIGHALGSVFTAMRNRTPLVITAGQQTRALHPTEPYLYATDAASFPKPYVKWSYEPARAEDVPAAIARAWYTALQRPQGPTFVSIPEDDWDVTAEPAVARRVDTEFVGDPEGLAAVADALNRGRRPALVVGPGVDRDGAWDLAVALAERIGAAVWVSPLSSRASFPENHPAFAGFLTPQRRTLAGQLGGHDVVVVLGAPVFTYHVPSHGPVLDGETELFQLIDDPEAAAFAPVGRAVLTTLRLGLDHLLAAVTPRTHSVPVGRAGRRTPSPSDPMTGAFVMHTIGQLMPPDAVVVEEAPSHRNAMHEHLPIRTSGGFYAGASGGLGWALPAAVGVALGVPERRVVCLLGDGSSLYSIQALWTTVQHRVPLTIVILNNGGYAALKSFGRTMGIEHPPGVDLPGIEFTEIAAGFGCAADRIEKSHDLEPAVRAGLASPVPTLLDVCVEDAVEPLY